MNFELYEPFVPTTDLYQFDKDTHTIYLLNLVTGKRTALLHLPFTEHYHFIAFNELDNCIYAYHSTSHLLCRIDQIGNILSHPITDLPSLNFDCGCIAHDGLLYLYESLDHTFYVVNLCASTSDNPWKLVASIPISPLPIHDWCLDCKSEILYSISELGQLITINPTTGNHTLSSCIGLPSEMCVLLVCDYNNYLYTLFSNIPHMYRLKISNNSWMGEIFCSIDAPCYVSGTRLSSSPLYLSYSSAPSPYACTLSQNMARHGVINFLRFEVDTESSAPPIHLNDSQYTYTVKVSNLTDKTAFLYAWIDFNNNGHFEVSEAIIPILIPPTFTGPTSIPIIFDMPSSNHLAISNTYMRLRLTTDKLPLDLHNKIFDTRSLGPASDGMIKDISISIIAEPPYCHSSYMFHCLLDKTLSSTIDVIDPSQGALTYKLIQAPTYGEVILDSATGFWEYLPSTSTPNEDSFIIQSISSITKLSCNIPITISLDLPSLKLATSCTHSEASYENILTYTCSVENMGNIPFSELYFKCVLPDYISFIDGSLSINQVLNTSANPTNGISLNHLGQNELFILSFDCIVTTSISHSSNLYAQIEGTFSSPQNMTPSTLLIDAKPLPLLLQTPSLDIAFTCSSGEVLAGDSLLFNAKISNTGSLLLKNIILTLPIQNGLSVEQEIIINHSPRPYNVTQGYTISSLGPQETVLIQFKGKVDSTAASHLEVLLFVDYEYLLSNKVIQSSDNVFKILLDILTPVVKISHMCHSSTASLGDLLHYTLTLYNEGHVPISKGFLTDQFPSCFQVTKLLIDDHPKLFTPHSPITLVALAPGATCTIDIYVKVLSIPKSYNLFKHTFLCSLTPKSLNTASLNALNIECTDSVGVLLIEANLSLEKLCNVSEASINEVVDYTLIVKNTGTIALYDVVVQDLLAPELEFISDSILLNQVPSPLLSIISGVKLGTLEPNDCIELTFQATILSKGSGIIENTASAYYTFFPDGKKIPKLESIYSNMCSISIIEVLLAIEGFFDKELALLNDTISCNISLKNKGSMDLFNIMFNASLHSCFILKRSFFVDNKLINNVDLSTPIYLGDLPRNRTIHITYQLQLEHSYLIGNTLENILSCHFAYNTTDKCVKYNASQELALSLPIALTSFKMVGLENLLYIPDNKPDIEIINSVSGQVDLLKTYVIPTPKGTSADGQILTGKLLLVHGLLNLASDYVSAAIYNPVHSIHTSVPFSGYIVIPEDTPEHINAHITPTIKNISFKAINNRSYFVHTTLLLTAYLR